MDQGEQGASSVGVCLVIGAAISFLVSWLKRFAWVENHTKLVAFFISVAVGVAVVVVGTFALAHKVPLYLDYSQIFSCIVVQFTAAVATHEVIVKPIADNLASPFPEDQKVAK